ncbi:MAG: DUF2721 domain-containing protein [Thermoplasmata archaeon]|nr:DUF2721 domain-containing protein [Thermoplasmata archaeon]
MDVISLITMTLAPLLLISATGLLILGLGTRLGRIIDRLREFSQEVRSWDISEERMKVILHQKEILLRRGEICKNSLVYYHFTIMFTAVSSVFIFLSAVWEFFQYFALATFILALLALLIGSIYAVLEISCSYAAVKKEAEVYLHSS